MRYTKLLTTLLLACATLTACEDEGGLENVFDPQTYDVQGKVEKGPFVSGSTLSIQPMDESLQVLGSLYNTTIVDNKGNFMVGSKDEFNWITNIYNVVNKYKDFIKSVSIYSNVQVFLEDLKVLCINDIDIRNLPIDEFLNLKI